MHIGKNSFYAVILLGLLALALFGSHAYLASQLYPIFPIPPPLTAAVLSLLIMITLSQQNKPHPFLHAIYQWLGFFFIALNTTATCNLILLLWPNLFSPTTQALLILTTALILSAIAHHHVQKGPRVQHITVHIRNLSPELAPLRIAQISDLHISQSIRAQHVQKVVEMTNQLQPDVIVLTGDIIDGPAHAFADDIKPLAQLRSRYGTYFVTGNHEYYHRFEVWKPLLQQLNIRILDNEKVLLGTEPHAIQLVGVNDLTATLTPHSQPCDCARAFAPHDTPLPYPTILLAHQPKILPLVKPYACDLILSGHTHGGQIWPFHALVRLAQPHVAGLFQHPHTQIYIHSGTGFWGPAMRLGSTSEIALLNLIPSSP
jgi:predicted MPP superfamily phosphohydrolase